MPSWAVRTAFKMLSPARSVQDRVKFLLALNDRDALLPRERQRRFLDSEAWTAYSGAAIAELLEQFITHNRMLEGGFVIDDRLVTLADIDVPVLTFVGLTDTLGHPDSVRAIRRAAPQADVYEVTLPGGHFGLVVGAKSMETTWPAVAEWVRWREGRAELPEHIAVADTVDAKASRPSTGGGRARPGDRARDRRRPRRHRVGAARGPVRARRGAPGARADPAAEPHRAAAPRHPHLAGPVARRAGAARTGGHRVPVRRPRAPPARREGPRRQRRQGPDRDRRPARSTGSAS